MAITEEEAQVQQNPLLEGLQVRATPDPCVLVIFGASGDLATKKLFPALYSLAFRRLLPEQFAILGVSRSEETDDGFRERMKEAVKEHARDPFHDEIWDWLADGMAYVATDFADEGGEDEVAQRLEELDEKRETGGNRVYYLAIPPGVFPVVVEALGKRRSTAGWTRLIVEKPFGHDLASARQLDAVIQEHFAEDEVFRIDHYLGKETVQNMLALRFANGIFEPIWNRQFIDHVQITVAESIGIEGRAGYYERAGAVRDIFQNHLLQLVALPGRDPPIDFTAESVRNEKVKVLRAMHTPGPKSVVRGQYGRGFVEGVEVPGQGMTIRTVHMAFLYGGAFRTGLPEAYERLILDAMLGDATLFTRIDEVEEQWSLVDAIVAAWARDRPAFPNYAAGTWGPPSADELLQRDGRSWRRH